MTKLLSYGFWKRALRSILLAAGLGTIGLILWVMADIYMSEQHDEVIAAARNGDLATVERLAPRDIYLSRTGFEEHSTPLGAATWSGQTKVVQFLIRRGVDVNALDDGEQTALHRAYEHNHSEIARMILEAGGHR